MTKAITYDVDIRKRVFWISLSFLLLLFFLYSAVLNSIINNGVLVDQYKKEIIAMNSSLGGLESEYLMKTGNLSVETAHEIGLVDDSATEFIKAPLSTDEVSLHIGE